MRELLNNERLHLSDVAANSLMNRGRGLSGANSYRRDLRFDPIEFLRSRLAAGKPAAWLDVGCGEGRALIEAAALLVETQPRRHRGPALQIIGIDLVGMFGPGACGSKSLKLMEMSVEDFEPDRKFDLITCVHALHYVGDKLAAIRKAAGWLEPDGRFSANLDVRNLKFINGKASGSAFAGFLSKQRFTVERRRNLIALDGGRDLRVPFEYVGADDAAGPNYTGPPAVDSYYRI